MLDTPLYHNRHEVLQDDFQIRVDSGYGALIFLMVLVYDLGLVYLTSVSHNSSHKVFSLSLMVFNSIKISKN